MNREYKISGFADEMSNELAIQITGIKELGMKYIEMRGVDGDNLIFHNDQKVHEIKSYLDANGIHLSALGSPLGKIGINDDFAPHYESFKRAVEVAHMMECPNIRIFSFYIPEGQSPSNFKSMVFDRIGSFVDYATANDAVLLHENEKGIYGEKAPECKVLMNTFYSDHFKAIFDFANFVQARQDTIEAYELLKPYIAYLHIKDAKWEDGRVVPAGYGDGHVEEILNALFASGYDGFLSLEPHLFNFSGFDLLEKDGKSIPNTSNKALSGQEAFTLAHTSLLKLLK